MPNLAADEPEAAPPALSAFDLAASKPLLSAYQRYLSTATDPFYTGAGL